MPLSTNCPERESRVHPRRNTTPSTSQDIIGSVHIREIYQELTGQKPRRTGADTWRGPAVWRGGDGLNVSLDDSRGIWHDFATDEGGGILDLVVHIRGGSRQDALRWVADFAGVELNDQPLPPEQRQQWAEERRRIERALPDAQHWRRAAVNMAEEILGTLKAALFDPTPPWPEVGEVYEVERVLARLRHVDGAELVEEYTWWAQRYPATTTAMIRAIRERELTELRALCRYLGLPDRETAAYLRKLRSAA